MSIRRRLADRGGHICPLICGKRAFKLARCGPLLFVFRSKDHGKQAIRNSCLRRGHPMVT